MLYSTETVFILSQSTVMGRNDKLVKGLQSFGSNVELHTSLLKQGSTQT